MNKTLDVHTAELITAAVEVKTLTIRGKQVTLAVFRQLEEKLLLLEDGSLAGVPWGRVNYHPDKCADTGAHMHVVWQDGSELRRARVQANPRFGTFWPDGNGFVSTGFLLWRLGYETKFWDRVCSELIQNSLRYSPKEVTFTFAEFPGVQVGADLDFGIDNFPGPNFEVYRRRSKSLAELEALDPDQYEKERAAAAAQGMWVKRPLEECIASAREECAAAIDDIHDPARVIHEHLLRPDMPSLEEERAALVAGVAMEHARRERIRSATAMLAELSQLFIAV